MKKLLFILTSSIFIFAFFFKNHDEVTTRSILGKAHILDGDTIKINGRKIRLINIDSAESSQKCYNINNSSYFCGKDATKFLVNLIADKEVECRYDKLDIYNRILGTCYLNKTDINLSMIRNGHAIIYSYKRAPEKYIAAESYAKENNLGLWQGSYEIPKDYRKRMRGKRRN